MPLVKAKELKRRFDLDGAKSTYRHLREALETKQLRPEDFSIRDLAEHFVRNTGGEVIGNHWVREACGSAAGATTLLEAGEGVDTTAFSNITGQLIYARVLEGYQHPAFVLSRLIPATPTRLSGEKIPGVTRIGEKAETIGEGMPYPHFGFGEEFVETPETTKRGLIVSVTREAIFFDRTHLVMRRAAEVGEFLGLNKEKRIVDVVIGATNNYKRNNVTSNTYLASGGGWTNDQSNPLIDWTSVDQAEQLLAEMKDPATGEPILITADTILAMPANFRTAQRIISATEITSTSSAGVATASDNPLSGQYRVERSQLAYLRIQSELGVASSDARQYWFLGRFERAFAYMENWPVTVSQAPAGSEAEFTRDVVLRFKASERGAAAVLDPRYVVRNKN